MQRLVHTLKSLKQSQNSNQAERVKASETALTQREKYLQHWLEKGGGVVIPWIKENYRMHNGSKLEWDDPFLEEVFLVMLNPWLQKVILQKPAQVGYTETLIAVIAYALAVLRIPIGLGFEAERKLTSMVSKRVQPAFDYCQPIQEISAKRAKIFKREDTNSKHCITVGGIPLELFYAKAQESKDDEQAASTIRSFTAYMICVDEFGLCDKGILDVAEARMAKSKLPNPITRAGSTPGIEGGVVDSEVRKSKYNFEWQVECPHCQKKQFLDAFGNFIKPVEILEEGLIEIKYVDAMGYPYDWFHRADKPTGIQYDNQLSGENKEQAFRTAFIGCSHCGEELDKNSINSGKFVCKNTAISYKDFDQQVLQNQKTVPDQVAVNIPKLASTTFKPEQRIRFMFSTLRPSDGIQQFLGKATSLGGGKIKLSRLEAGTELSPPARKHDITILGLDQGRYSNWYIIVRFWFSISEKTPEKKWLHGFKQVIEWGQTPGFDGLEYLVKKYDIDYIGADSEPEFNTAVDYALEHLPAPAGSKDQPKGQVFLFDQVPLKGEQYRRTLREVQRVAKTTNKKYTKKVPIYVLDRTFGLDCTRDRIYRNLQSFPKHTTFDPADQTNLFLHYLTSDRLPSAVWIESPGSPDHLHHADCFTEITALASLSEPGMSGFAFGGLSKQES